jgi:hypothetical protein
VLSCREVTELVTERKEGRLPLGLRLRYRLHRFVCPYCRCYERQMDQTVEALREVPPEKMAEERRAELLAKFRARSKG